MCAQSLAITCLQTKTGSAVCYSPVRTTSKSTKASLAHSLPGKPSSGNPQIALPATINNTECQALLVAAPAILNITYPYNNHLLADLQASAPTNKPWLKCIKRSLCQLAAGAPADPQ